MIKNYNINDVDNATHIIRVTFMYEDYIGHIAYKIKGNCKGGNLLDGGFLEYEDQESIDRYVENDCELKCDDGIIFSIVLHKPDGETYEWVSDYRDISEFIVAMEIVAFEPEEEN